MKMTTLCYIEENNSYLMLHRIKRKNDENFEKWVGIGGKFEAEESPEDCVLREIYEECGLIPQKLHYRGIITFISDVYGTEYMHLFTASECLGELSSNCDEGDLEWVPKNKIQQLNLWEGDRLFLNLIDREDFPFFSLKLRYQGDKLIQAFLNRQEIKLI